MADRTTLERLAIRRFIHISAPNPVFITGEPGAWDENFVEYCNVIKDGETHQPGDCHQLFDHRRVYLCCRCDRRSAPHPVKAWTACGTVRSASVN